MKKLTAEEFINKASKIHNNKYDYSLVNYADSKTKVKIICPEHGIFEQSPNNHTNKHFSQGCPKCSKMDITKFTKRAKQIHNNNYDYSKTIYINTKTKVIITCPIHGDFEQNPQDHLHGCGCKKCSDDNQKTTSLDFIEKANKLHYNKYDYSLVKYVNARTKTRIICPVHGVFEQTPYKHLQGQGCPFCFVSKGENYIKEYLLRNNILYKQQKTFKGLKDVHPLRYDFYLPDYNLLIEYNGGQHYKSVNYFGGNKKFTIQQKHDSLKEKYAKEHNIKLLIIPYWEFNNIDNILKEEIK